METNFQMTGIHNIIPYLQKKFTMHFGKRKMARLFKMLCCPEILFEHDGKK